MSGGERHTVPVDVHLIAVREGRKAVLDAVSGIAYGDSELVERGQRTLARLRAEHGAPVTPAGDAT